MKKRILVCLLFASTSSFANEPQCETEDSKVSSVESFLEKDYAAPSIFEAAFRTEDTFQIRFSVSSGSYPDGEVFVNEGRCLGQYKVSSSCEVEEIYTERLFAGGLIQVGTECYELGQND